MQAGRKGTSRTIEVFDVLPPEPTARRESRHMTRPVLIEDAVFEVVGPARPRREQNDNPAHRATGKKVDLARLAAVAAVHLVNRLERVLSALSTQAFATLAGSLFFVVFWLCGGFGALGDEPIAASSERFAIEKVFTEELDENGMRLLAVGGVLTNRSGTSMVTPSLSVAGEDGAFIGSVTPPAVELASGESIRFFGRLKLAGGKSGAVTIFPAMK